jgi:hypothetical protein
MLEHKENPSSNSRANITEGTIFLPIVPPIGGMGKKKNILCVLRVSVVKKYYR